MASVELQSRRLFATEMPYALAIVYIAALLAGCTQSKLPARGIESPLLFDPVSLDRSEKIAFLIPGALASIGIYSPAEAWTESGYALVYYRFPGLDGLPLDHELVVDSAATEISALANRYPDKPVRLLGYSTGGPIAILASQSMNSSDVRVAALSPAPPKAGGVCTFLRTTRDLLAASIRARTLDREQVWLEYYRALLFGRPGLGRSDLKPRIDGLVADQRESIVVPEGNISAAHTRDIRRWKVPEGFSVEPDKTSFFIGTDDPVFSTSQTYDFAELIGVTRIEEYPHGGHLIFLTHPEVFDDILTFFEE